MHQKYGTEDHCRTILNEGPESFQNAGEKKVKAEWDSSNNYFPQGFIAEKFKPTPGIVTVHGKCTGQPELGNTHHNFRVRRKSDHHRQAYDIAYPDKLSVKRCCHSFSGK